MAFLDPKTSNLDQVALGTGSGHRLPRGGTQSPALRKPDAPAHTMLDATYSMTATFCPEAGGSNMFHFDSISVTYGALPFTLPQTDHPVARAPQTPTPAPAARPLRHASGAEADAVVCFPTGTCLATSRGLVPAEKLSAGMKVMTRDSGYQRIKWTGIAPVRGKGRFAPIRFDTGAIGNPAPLLLAPSHRLLASGSELELLTGETEAFVTARDLVNGTSIRPEPCAEIIGVYVVLDRHEVILSDGCWVESTLPAHVATDGLELGTLATFLALFAEKIETERGAHTLARPVLNTHEARVYATEAMTAKQREEH